MNWEKLTAPEFEKGVALAEKVCILPIGVVEKHGEHLPLGMDTINAHEVATRASEIEPAMVFPTYYFGMNTHAKCMPGAIAIHFDLLLPLLEAVCDEIGRNGFTKIIIWNAHGGNSFMLEYFGHLLLDREKPYMYYFPTALTSSRKVALRTAKVDGHGGEAETSVMMALHPELVRDSVPADYGMPLGREPYRAMGVSTPTWWYADYPGMLMADRTPGSVEKGNAIIQAGVEALVELIRLVKKDTVSPKLYREFFSRCARPLNGNGR